MSDISPSRIGEDFPEEFKKAVDACETPDEVAALMRAAAIQVGVVKPDALNPTVLHEVPVSQVAQPRSFAKTLVINGQKHVVEATTEQGLVDAELAYMREIFGQTAEHDEPAKEVFTNVVYDPVSKRYRGPDGLFLTDEQARQMLAQTQTDGVEAARQADLELKFKRGEISAAQYIEASGVIDTIANKRVEQSWAAATQEFLNSDFGADWAGGDANVERMGKMLKKMGLTESEDKVAALAAAYQAMQEEDAETDQQKVDADYAKELAACTSRAEIDEVTRRYFAGRTCNGMDPDTLASSGFWNR
ncbi:MAG: hypothetical protein WAN23_00680 [Candidatus Acidiferrales bacterium]